MKSSLRRAFYRATMVPTMEMEFVLTPIPEVVAVTRAALAQLLRALPQEFVETTSLLVTELITNSLRHSDLTGGDHIVLRASVEADQVTVHVCDPGSRSRPQLQPVGLDSTWGRGLLLVEALARDWGFNRSERTCVWFELDVAPRPAA